jgi:hypothetical protein
VVKKERDLDTFVINSDGSQPAAGEGFEQVLESFIAAVEVSLHEWANTEVAVRSVGLPSQPPQR